MKIAQVIGPPLFLTGTGQSRVIPISKELIRKNHAVAIFTPTMNFSTIEHSIHEGIPVIKTGQYFVHSVDDYGFAGDYRREKNSLKLLSDIFVWSLNTIREVRKFKPDVIQVYTTQPNTIVFLLLSRMLMPFSKIYIDYDDLYGGVGGSYDYENNSKLAVLALGFLEKVIHRFASKASSCSNFFKENYAIDKIIPNSVDAGLLSRGAGGIDPGVIDAIRARHNIKITDKVIIAVSRFKDLYDYDLLIKAADILHRKERNFKILFIGDGEFKSSLISMSEAYKLSGNLTFTGWINDASLLKHYYYLSDICVLPMRNRKLHLARCPIKLLDAITAQLCIVAPDIGEPAHMLKNDITALFYKAGDSADIADKLYRLITDDALCATLRSNVKGLAPNYDHKYVARLWEEHFQNT